MPGPWSAIEWLALIEHELLLFAGAFFLIGALDELAIDISWLWLRLTGRARTRTVDRGEARGGGARGEGGGGGV
jgi:bacteriophage N4 adsorption protein B